MSAVFTSSGLTIQTYEEVHDEVLAAAKAGLGLTDSQVTRLRSNLEGPIAQLLHIQAEREAAEQENLLQVFTALSWYATGVALDNVVALLGVTRRAESFSRVVLTVSAPNGTLIAAGTRVEYNPTGSTWAVVADVTVGVTGSAEVLIEAEDSGAVVIEAIAVGDWTLLDSIPAVTGIVTDEQTITGAAEETDGELRARAAIEAYRRGQGPLRAIEAAVSEVDGVTFVKVFESAAVVATDTDANGIPGRSLNVVVQGGDSDDIAAAIAASRGGGIYLYAEAGATFVERPVTLSNGSTIQVRFNRVEDLAIWIEYTATTSTSEEETTPGVIAEIDALLIENLPDLFDIGADVLPSKIEAIVQSATTIQGVDDLEVRLSLDDGATDAYTRARRTVSLRQRAAFSEARISGTEA
jgi:copper chaperone CopZ